MKHVKCSLHVTEGALQACAWAAVKDHMMMDGLEDAYDNLAMGCLHGTADQYDMTREQMDEFALKITVSNKAIESGAFKAEITAHYR